MESLERKIFKSEIEAGQTHYTLAEFKLEIEKLGYSFKPLDFCRYEGKFLSGKFKGVKHKCISLAYKHNKTGLSAFDVSAPRDENFEKLQALRFYSCGIHGGRCISF